MKVKGKRRGGKENGINGREREGREIEEKGRGNWKGRNFEQL